MTRFDRVRSRALEQFKRKNPHVKVRKHEEEQHMPSSLVCPICHKPQGRETLYIDGFLESVLQSELARMTPTQAYVCLDLRKKLWIVDAQQRTFVPDMNEGNSMQNGARHSSYRQRGRYPLSRQRGRSPDTFQPVAASAAGLGGGVGSSSPRVAHADFQQRRTTGSSSGGGGSSNNSAASSSSAVSRYGPTNGAASPRSRGDSENSNPSHAHSRQFQYDPSNHSRHVPYGRSGDQAAGVLRGSGYRVGGNKFLPYVVRCCATGSALSVHRLLWPAIVYSIVSVMVL